ncbi:MAG: efflux RND transporter periplasmic adaptor subunit [Spirochaetes bacterium]|nr:efflux RND transporter periplasmic adaptor subunit [Spirochaetota bacterium]
MKLDPKLIQFVKKYFKLLLLGALIGLIFISITAAILRKSIRKEKEAAVISVRYTYPQKGELYETLSYTGNIEAAKTVTIIPKLGGILEELLVEAGDYVEKDQILAEIEKNSVILQYEKAKYSYEYAKKAFQRVEKLADSSFTSQANYDEAYSQYHIAETNYKLAKLNLDNATLKSPIDGVIALVHVEASQMVGIEVPICTITDIDTIKLKVHIAEKYYSFITEKKEEIFCLVNAVSYKEKVFEAKIHNISPFVSPENRTFWVELIIDNQDHLLTSGMFAEVEMQINRTEEAIQIPNEAIDENNQVWVINGNEQPEFRIVETGIRGDSHTEIRSGITLTDKVIYEGNRFLEENSQIFILNGNL